MPHIHDPDAVSPPDALARLQAGNDRFLRNAPVANARVFRAELAAQPQRPFAIVLGCSDSRMPVEAVFDQGAGDLFVVRVAGNVVAPSIVGSIEFAASQFGTRLVVVLGHTQCGAISATLAALQTGDGPESRNIRSITDRIAPHVVTTLHTAAHLPHHELEREAMHANIRASVDHLRHASVLLEDLVLSGRVSVVAAEYELETGRVTFLEG